MEHYPIFDKEYTSTVMTENAIHFKNYLAFTDIIVYKMQNNNTAENKEIPLTFFPIAKNIRMTASYMTKNVLEGKTTYIHNMARIYEEVDWKRGTGGNEWFPWLWARGRINKELFTNIEGWEYYFHSFTEKATHTLSSYLPIKPPDELVTFFIYLSCTKYVFQLNALYKNMFMKYKIAMEWPTLGEKVLAVQIRRGETCTRDGSVSDRPFFHLDRYIEKMDLMVEKNGYTHFYISTDSNEEIAELQRLRPEWKILYLPIDRSQFFRMDIEAGDLEKLCAKYPDRIPFVVDSGLADLFFISQCQGYISTISISEFSKCGWFMQIVEQGELTPYINLNDELLDMSKRNHLLMF